MLKAVDSETSQKNLNLSYLSVDEDRPLSVTPLIIV